MMKFFKQHRQSHYRWFNPALRRFGLALSAGVLSLSLGAAPLLAQPSPSPLESLPPQIRNIERSLPGISSLLTSTSSNAATGAVRLDGRKLFTIAVPAETTTQAKATPEDKNPLQSRIDLIEGRLWHIVEQGFDPNSLQVTAEADPGNRQPIIYVGYNSEGKDQQDQILTITNLDATVNGSTPDEWAKEVTQIIKDGLLQARQERTAEYLRQQAIVAGGIFLAMLLISWLLTLLQRRLRKERKHLAAQAKSDSAELSNVTQLGEPPVVTTALLQRRAANQQKQGVNDIQRRLLQLVQLLIWGGGVFLILGLFAQSRWLQVLMITWIKIPIRLLMVAAVTYIGIRLSTVLVDRLFWALQNSPSLSPANSQRLLLRFTTFSRVVKSLAVILCLFIGIILVLSVAGIQISPALLTGAGIIGVGISLASQNLIKDVINGFLILLEDQYGVGDVIVVDTVSGLVENMNLRITQLRNEEGRLITIPNSAITIVQNLSKEWSRVDLNISVAYSADLERSLSVINQIAQEMSQDPTWQALILETPTLLGVEKLDHMGVTIRLWIKTQPLKQWDVAREYRRRLKLAFDRAEIAIGIPQQSFWLNNADEWEHNGIEVRVPTDHHQAQGSGRS